MPPVDDAGNLDRLNLNPPISSKTPLSAKRLRWTLVNCLALVCILGFSPVSSIADQLGHQNHPLKLLGLSRDMAIVLLNGKTIQLRTHQPPVSGLKLIEASGRHALIDRGGAVHSFTERDLSQRNYGVAKAETVVVHKNLQGLYITQGYVEYKPVLLRIDPAAEAFILSSHRAQDLALNYQERGQHIQVASNSGVQKAYDLNLDSVSIGALTLKNVKVVVIEGSLPSDIIVGQTFLSRIELRKSKGMLQLTQALLAE